MPAIRRATASDRDAIVAFNTQLALESEGKRLDPVLLRRGVAEVLEDVHKGLYFLAAEGDTIIGQIMITFEWSDWRCGWFWWIQSVYVHPDHRGAGVYRALFEHVKRAAESRDDVCGLRLYVDGENTTAMRVYDRTGLVPAGYQMRELDFRAPRRAARR